MVSLNICVGTEHAFCGRFSALHSSSLDKRECLVIVALKVFELQIVKDPHPSKTVFSAAISKTQKRSKSFFQSFISFTNNCPSQGRIQERIQGRIQGHIQGRIKSFCQPQT